VFPFVFKDYREAGTVCLVTGVDLDNAPFFRLGRGLALYYSGLLLRQLIVQRPDLPSSVPELAGHGSVEAHAVFANGRFSGHLSLFHPPLFETNVKKGKVSLLLQPVMLTTFLPSSTKSPPAPTYKSHEQPALG
jgi:hypothetical protein